MLLFFRSSHSQIAQRDVLLMQFCNFRLDTHAHIADKFLVANCFVGLINRLWTLRHSAITIARITTAVIVSTFFAVYQLAGWWAAWPLRWTACGPVGEWERDERMMRVCSWVAERRHWITDTKINWQNNSNRQPRLSTLALTAGLSLDGVVVDECEVTSAVLFDIR